MVIHQSCELEYADSDDSRVIVAPIVSSARWAEGPWELIRRGALPGYFYLSARTESEMKELGLSIDWPDSAVVFASSTLVSRAMVYKTPGLSTCAAAFVAPAVHTRYLFKRAWLADGDAVNALKGKSIVDVQATVELVPGPSRLTKVFLADADGVDEVTVVCGVRPSRRAA